MAEEETRFWGVIKKEEKKKTQPALRTLGCRLLVHVKKAENVIAKDKGGTSDPFCQVLVGSETKKTEVPQPP